MSSRPLERLPTIRGKLGATIVRKVLDYPLRYIAENAGGIRAYEKAGFTVVGRLREEIWRDGRWQDAVEMACVRPDLGG